MKVYGIFKVDADSWQSGTPVLFRPLFSTLELADVSIPDWARRYDRPTHGDQVKNYAYYTINEIEVSDISGVIDRNEKLTIATPDADSAAIPECLSEATESISGLVRKPEAGSVPPRNPNPAQRIQKSVYYIIEHPTRGTLVELDSDISAGARFSWSSLRDNPEKAQRFHTPAAAKICLEKINPAVRHRCVILKSPTAEELEYTQVFPA